MSFRPGRTQPRTVLLGALLLIALAAGLTALAPRVLPVRIVEGPLVQQATENGAILVWYSTRPLANGECSVTITRGAEEFRQAAETSGRRGRARITGLSAGQSYPYRLALRHRTLATGELRTNQPAGQPFSFIVFGDSGTGSRAQYRLADRMLAPDVMPGFALHTGDLVYHRGQRRGFKDRFFVPYRHLLAQVAFWPALGNHDVAKPDFGQPYRDVFELPESGPPGQAAEHHYWFDYAAARIVVLDSNTAADTLATHVAPWLRRVLMDGSARWKFVALHHPLYTAGAYQPNTTLQRILGPIFDEAGVNIVFAGHDHNYQRTVPLRDGQPAADGRGVVYVVTGAAGGELYAVLPADQRPPYLAAANDDRPSFTHVRIDGDVLRLRQIDLAGVTLDDCSWTKPTAPAASGPSTRRAGDTLPAREAP